jgi:tetratricopeptide (TPR) repeat protein
MQDSETLEQAKSLFLNGLEKLNGSNFTGAEIDFQLSLKFMPNRLSTLINLSIVLIKLKKFEDAEKLINNGLIHHPNNKELLMGWQRAKDLYDAGVISNQQYDNATRAARAAVVKQYGQGWNNASTIYNMNRTESPYYAIDPASGRLAFHSPRAEQDFYNSKSGQGQDPLAMYDQLRKTYGDERAMELWKTMYGKSSGRGNTTTTTKTANGTTRKTTYDDE